MLNLFDSVTNFFVRVLNLIKLIVQNSAILSKLNLKLLMSIQENLQNKKNSSLCPECAVFYGSSSFEGLCSTCYKKKPSSKKDEQIEKSSAQTATPVSVAEKQLTIAMDQLTLDGPKNSQKDRKRCFDCNKKVGLLGIECKCGFIFCNGHRLPEDHNCQFDHKHNAKEKLKKQVVKVYNGKLKDI